MKKIKLPKITVRYNHDKESHNIYVDGKISNNRNSEGVRPKAILPEYGIVIKVNKVEYAEHDDAYFYKKIANKNKKYFPKLLKQTKTYAVHEYVPHTRNLTKAQIALAESLAEKYNFNNFGRWQLGRRKDNKELVYFDYSLL